MLSTPADGIGGPLRLLGSSAVMKPSKERRSDRRMRRRTVAWVTLPTGTMHQFPVLDLSAGGARLAIGEHFEIPEEIGISLVPNENPRPARVAWCKWGMAGIEFTDGEQGHS